ncbi:MAG: anion permease [Tyzzerella sp.]|uniref:Anion permease n=1 Tax=Candidatus Fimicola merdigallinarum TaxID=2840819 RepID=A0A9D9DX16_9FIRM|nr:anion permease [Candidatus Fimicola merdigallinarum]
MYKIKEFFKKETVLCCSGILAIISMFFVLPDKEYIGYMDFKVLALLFCLMGVVAGIKKSGFFDRVSSDLISKSSDIKNVSIILVMLCFFSSMLITNDVALITFVPLAVAVLGNENKDRTIFVIVMQTISANLGSMITPVGNPQNLYLYSYYNIGILEFFKIVLPIGILSFVLILLTMIFMKGEKIEKTEKAKIELDIKSLLVYSILFIVCILTVFNVLDYKIMLVLVTIGFIVYDRSIIREIDITLLATFVFFFIFVGNMERLEVIKNGINNIINGREMISSVVLSQVISNVPSALMLSGFTDNYKALLQGTNIGGLGTLVASLASLISFKIYAKVCGSDRLLYLKKFTVYNLAFLVILIIFTYMFL